MENIKSRILFSISIIVILITFTVPFVTFQAKAQQSAPVENNLDAVGLGLTGMLLGCQAEHIDPNLSYAGAWNGYKSCTTPEDRIESYNNSAFGTVVNLTSKLYETKPSSAMVWAEIQLNKIQGNDAEVLAQNVDPGRVSFYRPGPGLDLLRPVLGLSNWSRNLMLVFTIVQVLFTALLILFRRSFGGQTPITLFNAIPSIILSIFLITFSYPLSAIFIDIITVGTNLSQSVLVSGTFAPGYQDVWLDPIGSPGLSQNTIQPNDPEVGIWEIVGTSGVTPCAPTDNCDLGDLIPVNTTSPAGAFGGLLQTTLEVFTVTGGANFLIRLILGFTAFMASFKLFMTLLNKYVMLTLGPVLAPFYFFIAGVPSKTESTLITFFKTQFSAALTFIAIYTMFLFILVLGNLDSINELSWTPPLMGYEYNQVSGTTGLFKSLLVFAVYLATPTVPDLIDQALEVPESNPIAEGVKQRLQQGTGQLTNIARQTVGSTKLGQKIPFLGAGGR